MSKFTVGDTVRVRHGAQYSCMEGGIGPTGTAEFFALYDWVVIDRYGMNLVLGTGCVTNTLLVADGDCTAVIPKRTITLEDGKTVTLSAESYEALAREAK